MRLFHCFIVSLLLLTILIIVIVPVRADEYDELGQKIEELKKALEMSKAATTPLEATLKKLESDIADIRQRIANLESEVERKEQEVAEGEKALEVQQKILESRVRSLYKKDSLQLTAYSLQLLFAKNLSKTIRLIGYQKSLVEDDKKIIMRIVLYIKDLEVKKAQLEREKSRLASVKQEIDKQAEFFRKEIKGARDYQAELEKEIAELIVQQQQIIAQRQAALRLPTTLGAGPLVCTDDRKIDPGFTPAFAFYTFGIPHRVGMNQYGALGRAKAGQNEEEILKVYYDNFELKKDYDSGVIITVDGYGSYNIEDYVKRIYEMPNDWANQGGMAALKAQAIAARSYALAYTDNGTHSICPTQKCQVFKPEEKGGAWNTAVEETRGWVMVHNGRPITAWYASTAGGYLFNSGDVWQNTTPWTKRTRDTGGTPANFQDLHQQAYDRESPCFYAAQGWRSEYAKSAWLKPSEVADIVNALLLVRLDGSLRDFVYQTDKPHPYGREVWNEEKVKQEIRSRGKTPFNSISSISIGADFNQGITNSVSLSGDAGSESFNGKEFKDIFNVRAPANIQIVGPLFNIEKK